MKKFTGLLSALILCFALTACGSSASGSGYTKEFDYLPVFTERMELQSFAPIDQSDYSQAIYIIENTENAAVLEKYEEILLADGWTVYEDKKPISIGLNKEDHVLVLLPQQVEDDVHLMVVAK